MPRVTFSSAAAYTVPWKERQVALHEPKELANRLRQNPDALQSVLRSPDGQRLLQLLSGSDGGQALQQAAQQAESGSTAQLVQLLRRVMSTPDGAALAGRIMQQLQQ